MSREEMMDRMIRLYGHENPVTISFCKLAESFEENEWNDRCLRVLVEAHEANPVVGEE